ncbi:unnamed protein product [Effrenium voratum]|uniref:Uncharacterized protein n=1 Tax=Effrenium voratum TaxID=2562239 RepID=A0AA36JHY9_9DINO|nr:unnamed protein product [Effrenium voratum]CAJ1459475.1 unnamed protein product [Effrenium voratum]
MGSSWSSGKLPEEQPPGVKMWVIKVSDFLKLNIPMPPHEELEASKLLHRWEEGHFCIFVSHQWLGNHHPDPSGEQFQILQEALRKILDGSTTVSRDIVSEFYGDSVRFTEEDRCRLQGAYLWLDWVSVPQAPVKLSKLPSTAAFDELSPAVSSLRNTHKVVLEKRGSLTTQDVHILSIPSFVQQSDIFLALVPPLQHQDTGLHSNYCSWFDRGWCRMEMWCKMLSEKASSASMPMIVVSSPDRATLETPPHWIDRPPHEGNVTFDTDHDVIFSVMQHVLDQRLKFLGAKGKSDSYQYLLARYEAILGLPVPELSLEVFCSHFGFSSVEAATLSTRNIGAMACAVASGNAKAIYALAEAGVSPNLHLKPVPDVRIMSSLSLIHLAVDVSWRQPEVLQALLELRADPNEYDDNGHPVLGFCRTARDVEALVRHGADVNQQNPPASQLAISVACEFMAPPEVISKLLDCGSVVNPMPATNGLGCPHPLSILSLWAWANPSCLEVARILVNAKADVNHQATATGRWRAVELASRAYLQCSSSSSMLLHFFAEWSTTPLGMASFFGSEKLVAFFLAVGADPEIPNWRGHTPIHLARTQTILELIQNDMASTFSM